jgi:6-phosphofructokinase 1
MNAAQRAVVRTALHRGAKVYAIYDGYQGMVGGGAGIRALDWNDVGGIMRRGRTIIGTAGSAAFRTRAGRLLAAKHLPEFGIGTIKKSVGLGTIRLKIRHGVMADQSVR